MRIYSTRIALFCIHCSFYFSDPFDVPTLVVPAVDGEELTIWDSKESEFSSGLEYKMFLSSSDPVNDLDWSATPDSQSILAVGFAHRVELLCQQRMTYFDEDPGWGVILTIDIERCVAACSRLLVHAIS